MFLVDTNVLSELRLISAGRGHPAVRAWNEQYDAGDFFLSAITLFETESGILRLERRDPRQGVVLRDWMTNAVIPVFEDRILPVNQSVAMAVARFHVPDPAPFAESLIAATALIHGLTVATRNTGDFRFPGVVTINPWDHPLPPAGGGGIS